MKFSLEQVEAFGDTAGVGVTTGAGVGDTAGVGVTTGAGVGVTTGVGVGVIVDVGNGLFFTKDVKVVEFKSNEPGTQNLQRSVVPVGTSTETHG